MREEEGEKRRREKEGGGREREKGRRHGWL